MLKVMTWLWYQQPNMCGYGPDKVNLWADQIRRNLTIPHQLACVTDHPEGIDPSIEIIPMQHDFDDIKVESWSESRRLPQCYRRLTLFAPDAEQRFGAKRIVSMDIDMIVTGSLDPVFDHDDDFRILKGTAPQRPYNGGMVQITAGVRPHVFTKFTVEGAKLSRSRYVGSDQAWISHILGNGEKVWGPEHGVYYKRLIRDMAWRPPAQMRILFFPGTPKPWDMKNVPFVRAAYGGKPMPASKPILHAYDDPTHWGKWVSAMANKRGIKCRLFNNSLPTSQPVFVRLDQAAAQRAISKSIIKRLHNKGCTTLPTLKESELYDDKVAQYPVLKRWMPETRILKSLDGARLAAESMTFPVISKSAEGSSAANVRVLRAKADALDEASRAFGDGIKTKYARKQQGYVYWQDIVSGNDCDYRVCVVGQYLYGLRRKNRPGTLFASGSGNFEVLAFKTEREIAAARLAVEISQNIQTQWMAYDIVFDGDMPMVLEMSSAWTMESYKDCRLHTFDLSPTELKGMDSFGVAVDILAAAQVREAAA